MKPSGDCCIVASPGFRLNKICASWLETPLGGVVAGDRRQHGDRIAGSGGCRVQALAGVYGVQQLRRP